MRSVTCVECYASQSRRRLSKRPVNAERPCRCGRLCLCVLLALGPGTASAAEKAFWGSPQLPTDQSAFPVYKDLGIDTFQMQLTWNTVAPTRPGNPADPADPAYHWPATVDAAIADAREHRIRVALMISGARPWANGGHGSVWAPSTPQDFAQFAAAASKRYPQVRRWMIWCEPNLAFRFKPNPPTAASPLASTRRSSTPRTVR